MCAIHEFRYDCGHFQKKEYIICEDLHCPNKKNKKLELEVDHSQSWVKCQKCLINANAKHQNDEIIDVEMEALSEAIDTIVKKAETGMHNVLTEFGLGGKEFKQAELSLNHVLRHIPTQADPSARKAAELLQLYKNKRDETELDVVYEIMLKAIKISSDEMYDVLEELGLAGPECAPFKEALDMVFCHIREEMGTAISESAKKLDTIIAES